MLLILSPNPDVSTRKRGYLFSLLALARGYLHGISATNLSRVVSLRQPTILVILE